MGKIAIYIILVFQILNYTPSKRVVKLIKKEVLTVFKIESYETKSMNFTEADVKELPVKLNNTNFFQIDSNSQFLGYYYIGQAFGKADYFDFLVIFDKDLVISKVKVLVYREEHGGEIGSKRWLKQFIGKSDESEVHYPGDIAGISGATISVQVMTNEINKLLQSIAILQSNNKL